MVVNNSVRSSVSWLTAIGGPPSSPSTCAMPHTSIRISGLSLKATAVAYPGALRDGKMLPKMGRFLPVGRRAKFQGPS